MIPTLHTERLTLRAPSEDDFPPFRDFYAGERSRFVGGPLTAEMSWRMLAMEIGHWWLRGFGRFIVAEKSTGTPVGLVGPFCPHGWPEPEIGWDLFDGFEGRGYATEAALATREWAYDALGWTTAISLVKPANTASARLAERMGAVLESIFTHERHGPMQVWRHPHPEGRACVGSKVFSYPPFAPSVPMSPPASGGPND